MSNAPETDRRDSKERRIDIVRRNRRRRFLRGAGIALVAMLAVRAWVDRPPPSLDVLPPSLLGNWMTDDERYADRAFVIGQDELQLHVGDSIETYHSMVSVQEVVEADHWAYEINYNSPDGPAMEFFLHADGALRLKNPNDVAWTRR